MSILVAECTPSARGRACCTTPIQQLLQVGSEKSAGKFASVRPTSSSRQDFSELRVNVPPGLHACDRTARNSSPDLEDRSGTAMTRRWRRRDGSPSSLAPTGRSCGVDASARGRNDPIGQLDADGAPICEPQHRGERRDQSGRRECCSWGCSSSRSDYAAAIPQLEDVDPPGGTRPRGVATRAEIERAQRPVSFYQQPQRRCWTRCRVALRRTVA